VIITKFVNIKYNCITPKEIAIASGMYYFTLTQRYSSKCEVFTKHDINICNPKDRR